MHKSNSLHNSKRRKLLGPSSSLTWMTHKTKATAFPIAHPPFPASLCLPWEVRGRTQDTLGFAGCVGESPPCHPHGLCSPSPACWAPAEPQSITVQPCWKDLMGTTLPTNSWACLHGKTAIKINVLWHKQVRHHQLQLHSISMYQLWILLLWSFGLTLSTKLKSVYADKAFHLYPQNGARPRHITFWQATEKNAPTSFHAYHNSKFIHK